LGAGQSKALLVGLYPFSQVSFLDHGLLRTGGLVQPNQMIHIMFYPPRDLLGAKPSDGQVFHVEHSILINQMLVLALNPLGLTQLKVGVTLIRASISLFSTVFLAYNPPGRAGVPRGTLGSSFFPVGLWAFSS
jgi:hypothetical protein